MRWAPTVNNISAFGLHCGDTALNVECHESALWEHRSLCHAWDVNPRTMNGVIGNSGVVVRHVSVGGSPGRKCFHDEQDRR